MNYKTFISNNGWFSLTLPEDWDEYDDESEDTCAFFNSRSWTGNLRITPFRWTNIGDRSVDKAGKYVSDELNRNAGATKIRLGDLDCAYYTQDNSDDDNDLFVYYWTAGKATDLFICSFTIDKDQKESPHNKRELEIVQDIIKSIKIH